jgi:Barstar (barnase inhibitor)
MDALCTRLLDANEAGTYRLNCPPDELRAAVVQAGFALFEADLAAVQGKGEFLAAVARAISAPDWFGHNFDALADALGDLSWRSAPGYVLLLRNGGKAFGLTAADYSIVTEIFADTVSFWRLQGKPFWVFFS